MPPKRTAYLLAACVLLCWCASAGVVVAELIITAFPHFQTFDSWNECSYVGTCYELYCNSIQGGWVNPEFHPPVAPFTEEVRSWWVHEGPTTSNLDKLQNYWPCANVQTGPCWDHTQGAGGAGKYMYVDASACFGYKFRVNSPTIVFSNSSATMSYYQFLYGIDLDRSGEVEAYLQAKLSIDNGTTWVILNNQQGHVQTNGSSAWDFVSIDLDPFFPAPASLANPVYAHFQFEARTGGDRTVQTFWKGDMAVDDIVFTQAGASTVLVPYIDPPVNGTSGDSDSGDGIDGGQIAGIVVGVAGGLGALCCCCLLLLLLLLLLISPRGPKKGAARATEEQGDDGGDEGNDGL